MLTSKKILFITFYLVFITKCISKDYCGVGFCNNSQQHTLCKYPSEKPANACLSYERTILSDMDKRLILDKINSRRNKVAAGEIRSLPPAAGMMKLEWNVELEKSAQRWADQCVKHGVADVQDICRDLGSVPVGQNVATVQGDSPGLTPLALVDVWYMELLKINASVISRYVPSSEFNEQHYDYFTQLIWEETKEVGCGGVKFQERLDVKYRTIYRLICNFAPAGNRRNKTVYSCGSPCSACPSEVCDHDYTALCEHKAKNHDYAEKETYDEVIPTESNILIETPSKSTTGIVDPIFDAITLSAVDMRPENESLTFNYFPDSHDSKVIRERITSVPNGIIPNDALLNDFIELLKKKLSSDVMIKKLLSHTAPEITNVPDTSFTDAGVAAFINKVYSKKGQPTTVSTTSKDFFNSTLLVDLIEAVIFRSNDKISTTEIYRPDPQTLSIVQPVKVQAELAEVKQNREFTGHYFFPEEDDGSGKETTDSYYDSTNLAQAEVEMEIEHLKMSSITKDFLDDIFESDTSTEKIVKVINDDLYANNMKNMFSQGMRRKRRDTRLNGRYFRDTECSYGPMKLPNRTRRECCKSNNKKYLSYKVLLRKIANDLSKLKLNALFPCTHNNSVKVIIEPMLLLFCTFMLFIKY